MYLQSSHRRPWQRSLLAGLAVATLLAGCTTRNWYEGMQESQRQQCRQRYPSASDQQDCIDRINSKGYEQYQREREALPRNSPP
jgi:hypothetical protein